MSSGFSYPQPIFESPVYNPAFYLTLDASGYLTYDYAQTLYLDKNDYRLSYITGLTPGTATQGVALVPGTNNDISGIGALSCTSLTVNGSSVSSPPTYVVGITPGTAANNKALVLGASGEIATITSLTAISITGTLQTAAQTNITSLGTLTGLTIGGNLTFTGASRTITGLSTLTATTLTGSLSTAAQTNITSIGTLSNLTLATGGTGLQIPNLKFWNSTTSLYDNFDHLAFIGFTYGGAVASKALIVDSNKDIGSIRTLNAVNLNASTKVSGTLGDFGSIQISATNVITSSRDLVNIGSISMVGAVDTTSGYRINGSDVISASGITGTLLTAAQSNITSLGVLTGLGLSNITSLGTSSAASAYELQFQDPSNASGSTSGISFTIHSSAANSTITPSASIIATSSGIGSSTNYPAADISFMTRNVLTTIGGSMRERMRIHANGNISMGRVIGDSNWNMLYDLGSSTLRFGAELSTKSCYSLTWNYTAAGSDSNYLSFNCYGTSNTLVLTATDRVGVGTSTPAAGLDVSAYASVSMTGPLATGTSSAYTVNRSGTYTDSVSIYCRQALMVGVRGAYIGSDRRVKEDISTIPPEDGIRFVRDINPKIYTLKGFDKRQIGYISQDMMADYSALISLLPDQNMTIEEEGDVDGAFLSMSYERVPAFLHACLKSVLDRLDEQQAQIDELRAIISE